MKKTKIVCTLGPSSDTKEIISAMADAGMNVVRLNFSHGTHADHAKKIQTVKEVRNEKKIPLPIMLDTKGPEFRIKTFKNGKVSLKEGSTFRFTSEDVIGDENRVGVSYSDLAKEMRPGNHIDIIAKIENRAGVKHLEEIMKVSDGIMVARGDLGVEIPYEELPDIQKSMISNCRIYGKRVITATEMLESMIHNPRPTRAEISDVANAVYDGTSAVMLSGETAAGAFPVESVAAMAKIVERAENNIEYIQTIDNYAIKSSSEALSHSACTLAKDLKAKAIVVCTRTGATARMVSRFRPLIPIIGLTTDERAYRQLALSWGVQPAMADEYSSVDILFYFAKLAALKSGMVKKGDTIVITGGTPNGKSGNSSLINVENI